MRFARLRSVARTLRFRLMLWNAAAMLLMVAATLLVVRGGLQWALLHELDGLLRENALHVQLTVGQFYPELGPAYAELDRDVQGHAHHGWFVQICRANGEPIWSSQNTPSFAWPEPPRDRSAYLSSDEHRLLQTPLTLAGAPPLLIRTGVLSITLSEDLALVTEVVLLGGAVMLFVVPLGAYWLASRAVEPVANIIHTARRLHPRNLDERLPLRGSQDELDQLSATINDMLDRLADHVARQRDFIADAAHELRSPLAAIRGSVELALSRPRSAEDHAELLAVIEDECAALTRLVNQLLLLAESESSDPPPTAETAALNGLVAKAVDMFQGVAESKGVALQLVVNEPVMARGTELQLRQLANNLIDNAVKFTPAGGRVTVSLRYAAVPPRCILAVADTGPGIPADALPRIFDRFFQVDRTRSRSDHRRGSGLGLAICHSIVERAGGVIEVASEIGAGSVFTVTLPATQVEGALPGAGESAAPVSGA